MLSKFKVKNFKNFLNEFVLDFTDTKNYEFNSDCLSNGVVKKALIYGRNGSGKSNLGYAIFDLIALLSNKNSNSDQYRHYLNALSGSDIAEFEYEFRFGDDTVLYKYGKTNHETLVYEKLLINAFECLSIDRRISTIATIDLDGAEHLKKDMKDSNISLINYTRNNAVLLPSKTVECFFTFITFIEGMLFFRSLHDNAYIGFEQGANKISADIIKDEISVKEFEVFLNKAGIDCSIKLFEDSKETGVAFVFEGKLIPFFDICSTGTRALTLFYYWYKRMKSSSNSTFVYIDEFDAFYHHELSALIIGMLKELDAQVILTTHNTSVMKNDILRPDCNFIMTDKGISPTSSLTNKDLRSAHNIEKMYRAGVFSG